MSCGFVDLCKNQSTEAARGMQGVFIVTVLSGCKTLIWHKIKTSRVRAVAKNVSKKYMMSIEQIDKMKKIRILSYCHMCTVQKFCYQRVVKNVSRWY